MIVLDTNVVSELMRSEPDPRVQGWVSSRPANSQYTTSITQAEVLLAILLLPAGRRRNQLHDAAVDMFEVDFAGRVLGFESDAAALYATIASERKRAGRPISHFDAQIAAIARAHAAGVVTRNVGDFEGCGVTVVNPWLD